MASPSDRELYDRLILARIVRRAVFLERYKVGEVRRILRFLEGGVFEDMTDVSATHLARIRSRGPGVFEQRQWKSLLDRLGEVSGAGFNQAHGLIRSAAVDLAKAEAAWTSEILMPAATIRLDTPSNVLLRKAVTSRPFQGKLLREWAQELERDTRARVLGEIRTGIMNSETVETMVRRIRGTRAKGYTDGVLQVTRHEAERVVRTATQHVVNAAREETFRLSPLVRKVVFVATLDSITCPTCGGYDGTTWAIGSGPRPPLHFFCRCSTTIELDYDALPGFDASSLPPLDRASIAGPVEYKHFPTWLRQQPLGEQQRVLGRTGARIFRSGKVPLRKFSDFRLRSLSQRELDEAFGHLVTT